MIKNISYRKYLNIQHDYASINCLSLICSFYENELGISWEEERKVFNNFQISSIKELRKIPIEDIYKMSNWIKKDLTNIQPLDIIVYTRNSKLAHFSLYLGDYKILNLVQESFSKVTRLDDTQRNNIESVLHHRNVDPELYRITL